MLGAITNKDRNSDRPISTWLGGVCCRPRAWRKIDRTIMIRVKLVIIKTMDGNIVSSPITIRICSVMLSGAPSPETSSSAFSSASEAPGVSVVAGADIGAAAGAWTCAKAGSTANAQRAISTNIQSVLKLVSIFRVNLCNAAACDGEEDLAALKINNCQLVIHTDGQNLDNIKATRFLAHHRLRLIFAVKPQRPVNQQADQRQHDDEIEDVKGHQPRLSTRARAIPFDTISAIRTPNLLLIGTTSPRATRVPLTLMSISWST